MDHNIFTTIYTHPSKNISQNKLLTTIQNFYQNKPFIHIIDHLPTTKHIAHTNFYNITIQIHHNTIIILTITNNLIKSTTNITIQNFNLISKYNKSTALLT